MIERIDHTDRNLLVWMDGSDVPVVLPWIWVRDHSRDPSAFDGENSQRTVDTFSIGSDLRAQHLELVDDAVIVQWYDSTPPSTLPGHVIVEAIDADDPTRRLWGGGMDVAIEPVAYRDIIGSDAGRARWLRSIVELGFAIASEVPTGREAVTALVDRVGYVRRTVFGDSWTLASTLTEHADSAYGEATLEPHTDGSYSHDAPGLQLFACQERTGDGGESVLVDGFAAAESLRRDEPESFAVLTQVPVPGQYIEPGVHLRAARPTIRLGRQGGVEQITFNNYDRSPFVLPPDEMHRWYDAYRALHELIVDRSRWWVQRLEPGDAVIFDNWRCLHGRMSFTGSRVFEGCYLNREDLESAVRTAL